MPHIVVKFNALKMQYRRLTLFLIFDLFTYSLTFAITHLHPHIQYMELTKIYTLFTNGHTEEDASVSNFATLIENTNTNGSISALPYVLQQHK